MTQPSLVLSNKTSIPSGGGTTTIDCTGADFLVAILVYNGSGGIVESAPTAGGTALTTILQHDYYQAHIAIFGLVNPTQGVVTVTVPGFAGEVTACILEAWKNVDTTTPFYSAGYTSGGTTYPTTVNIPNVISNDIINAIFAGGSINSPFPTWSNTTSGIQSSEGLSPYDTLFSVVSISQSGNPVPVTVTAGGAGDNHLLVAFALTGTTAANGIPSLTLRDKNGALMAAGTSVSVTVDTTTGTNVFSKTAQTITSANQIPVIDLSSAVTAGTIANGDTVNYRVDYAGETTIVPQTVTASPT